MSFVPVVPHVPARPSWRAQELGSKLRAVVDEYRRAVPDTTETEIRQALQLAETSGEGRNPAMVIGVLIGLVALLGLAFLLRGGGLPGIPVVALLLGGRLVAGLRVAVVRARRR